MASGEGPYEAQTLALGPNGALHAVFTRGLPKHAKLDGGTWTVAALPFATIARGSAAVSANESLYVAYRDSASGHLAMAWLRNGTWTRYSIDTSSGIGYPNLILSAGGSPHLAYTYGVNAGTGVGTLAYFGRFAGTVTASSVSAVQPF